MTGSYTSGSVKTILQFPTELEWTDALLTLFPAGGQNYVNLRGGEGRILSPIDLEIYQSDFDATKTIQRAMTRSL